MDTSEVASIFRAAAAARNGWKIILARCSPTGLSAVSPAADLERLPPVQTLSSCRCPSSSEVPAVKIGSLGIGAFLLFQVNSRTSFQRVIEVHFVLVAKVA